MLHLASVNSPLMWFPNASPVPRLNDPPPCCHRNSSSRERYDRRDGPERLDRGYDRRDDRGERDRNRPQVTKRSFSRETEGRGGDREQRSGGGGADPVRRVASMTDDRGSRERARSKESGGSSPPEDVQQSMILLSIIDHGNFCYVTSYFKYLTVDKVCFYF